MENDKNVNGKPMKFILHMAKRDKDLAGKAVSFDRNKETKFQSLEEFRDWLDDEILKCNIEMRNTDE